MSERILHCWKGKFDDLELDDPNYMQQYVEGGSTCMLPAGHDGPHEWTPDLQIGIRFEPVP